MGAHHMARTTEPDNKNFLSPIGFQFSIQKLPHVNYFCTSASIPDMNMSVIEDLNSPFSVMPEPGDKISFGDLSLNFRIDEDMKNYREIYDWISSIGYPDTFDQRVGLRRANFTNGETMFSDGSLLIMTNQYKPNVEVKFIDLFPISLSALEFNIDQTDVEYLQGEVSFKYRKYELLNIV
jgi:hypothetical protein